LQRISLLLLLLIALPSKAEVTLNGHLKALGRQSLQASHHQLNSEQRVNLSVNKTRWSAQLQAVAQQCNEPSQCQHWRVDRANLFWSKGNLQVTLGKHAISWGNGLVFNPVDVFNPFNPLAIDTEYKPGSNMLHLQYGLDSGNDIQALRVEHGNDSSTAIKYHLFYNAWEWDVIAAKHLGDDMAALGFSRPLGEWLWRTELTHQKSTSGIKATHLISNLQHFFSLNGKPASVILEWFHNGWGIDQNSTSDARLELFKRMARGEIFTPGSDYASISLGWQPHPLWQLGLTHISEAHNDSHISQFFSNVNLTEALQLRIAVALPWRDSRHIDLPTERYLMAQLAWYF